MIHTAFLIAFVVLFIHATTWEGMINEWIGRLLFNAPEWIKKPLYACPVCMSFWWGLVICIVGSWAGALPPVVAGSQWLLSAGSCAGAACGAGLPISYPTLSGNITTMAHGPAPHLHWAGVILTVMCAGGINVVLSALFRPNHDLRD